MGYRGEVITIPLGQLGIITDLPPSDIPPGAMLDSNNITVFAGVVEKARGSRKYNSSALPAALVAMHDWHPNIYTQRLIVATADGKIFRDDGDKTFGGTSPIKTGLGVLTPNSQFVAGGNEVAGANRKLFYFSAANQLQVLAADQSVVADIENPAADWITDRYPKLGLIHRNRLWGFSGTTAYGSLTDDHEDFLSSGNLLFNIFPGEGGDINGAFVFKGRMFVFKEGGFVYYLDDTHATATNWFFRKLGTGFGLASPNSIIQALDDMIAGNTTGSITSYTATQAFGDIESADILATNGLENYVRTHTSLSGVPVMHAIYYEEKKQVFFTYSSKYGVTNDTILTMDMNRRGTPRITLSNRDAANVLGMRKDINNVKRPIYGDALGFVYLMDQEDRLVEAASYEGSLTTSHLDFHQLDPTLSSREKIYDWISVEYIPEGPWSLSAEIFIDGESKETINFKQMTRSNQLGNFLLGTDVLGSNQALTSPRQPLHGIGRRISVRFFNSGSNQSFRLANFTIGFRPAGGNATTI